jgi:hypothetical protein
VNKFQRMGAVRGSVLLTSGMYAVQACMLVALEEEASVKHHQGNNFQKLEGISRVDEDASKAQPYVPPLLPLGADVFPDDITYH